MTVYIINYERLPFRAGNTLIDGSSLFVSSDCSNIERGTDTYTSTRYDFSGLHYEPLRSSENSLLAEFFASPEIFGVSRQTMQEKQVIQKKEEQEVILADTSRPWAIEDLLFALNRISRPTPAEVEDIPLSVDPDDYPVV